MRQVVSPIIIVQKILGRQKPVERDRYRLSVHCMRVERPEGVLLYHTLTGELLLLSHAEEALLGALPGLLSPLLSELVARWFLCPDEVDDMALADQVREIVERFGKKEIALTEYTIFTTTDCNARCFYCYEAGWKKAVMTEQVARDTAEYIAAHCSSRPVHLHWFGGEPLVNIRAIDVITDCLRRQGVEFRSTMTSNGYLFNEEWVQRARDDWNLKYVQITLDGTEEVYNQRKAYVNPQDSPYQRVLGNIGLLLDAGILVRVRMNMDEDNELDLYALVDELAERFTGKSGLGVYPMALYENVGTNPVSYTEKKRCSYTERLQSMRAYIEEKGIMARAALKRGFVANACLADSESSTTITPDGYLGRCESICERSLWGSVFSLKRDEEVLRQWRERKPPEKACKVCVVYPRCVRVKKCPNWSEHCTPLERSFLEDRLRRAVLGVYEDWKAAGQVWPVA